MSPVQLYDFSIKITPLYPYDLGEKGAIFHGHRTL